MRNNKEYILAKQIAQFMRYQYPKIIYHFDLAGLNLSRAQAGMMKAIQGKRGFPDLFIAQANECYHGLFLELKTVSPFKKDGTIKKDKHLEEQDEMHIKLRSEGYCTKFVVGYEETEQAIKYYLNTYK